MILPVIAFIGIIFGAPDLAVRWAGKRHQSINLTVAAADDRLKSCLTSGFEVRYRFEMRLCESKANLFLDCKDTKVLIRTLEYDPISESYRMTSDLISDSDEPENVTYPTQEDGLKSMATISGIPLTALGARKGGEDQLVNVRLISDCKGEYNETLARIGYFLSLGIIRLNERTTGWISFALK